MSEFKEAPMAEYKDYLVTLHTRSVQFTSEDVPVVTVIDAISDDYLVIRVPRTGPVVVGIEFSIPGTAHQAYMRYARREAEDNVELHFDVSPVFQVAYYDDRMLPVPVGDFSIVPVPEVDIDVNIFSANGMIVEQRY